jgi:acyl-CoA ligase (AMP-forming) (exosortase A-associated)
MPRFIHSLIFESAEKYPQQPALGFKDIIWNYAELADAIYAGAKGLRSLGITRSERVGIYLPKQIETVTAMFSTSAAGSVFVPINPLLKAAQVEYILRDCNVRILVTQSQRIKSIQDNLKNCPDLHTIVCVDSADSEQIDHIRVVPWLTSLGKESECKDKLDGPKTDGDIASILYTSGSTGNPKGVVLSHRNMVVGAESVAEYLENTSKDRILAVLPFSFDYGLSQLTTAFNAGATVYLMDYLLPNDIVKAIVKYQISGLAAVPPLWAQLTKIDWPQGAGNSLRYFTNSGGAMPVATLEKLQLIFANASPYLMYGLTEAFRSTYLPPSEVKNRPTSMGKSIPNAEVLVVRSDGSECAPNEPGELVHCGPLVSLGYWNAPEKTAARFKPAPAIPHEITTPVLSVWSGDTAYKDEEGFLFFVGRMDDMIKTSGYRVSPTEVEETIYASGLVIEAAAIGIEHPELGQAVVIVVTLKVNTAIADFEEQLIKLCQKQLPNFMVPRKVVVRAAMPHNANGKIDRKVLVSEYGNLFTS